MKPQHYDVIIIGAGLSGIGCACHISREHPQKSLAILERRERMGGTWDLFRYPGIRSDSDMASFGYKFKPWLSNKVLAKGPDIRNYVVDTAKEFGIKDQVQFGLKVLNSNWSSKNKHWEITAEHEPTQTKTQFTCQFLINCTGYYDYDKGYQPDFQDMDRFKGKLVHPQLWPEDLDYSGKKVVVIGSGATAITVVPAMSKKAEHVTMLQRSPSFIMSVPDTDKMAILLNKLLPETWVFRFARLRNILFQRGLYLASMRWPLFMRKLMLRHMRKSLTSSTNEKHISPRYNPWEERLCAAPDGDFFDCINEGKASIVTDEIDRFTESGVQLKSGQHIDADIIVSATGLNILLAGGMDLSIDNEPVNLHDKLVYKSLMIEDIPNFGWVFGYTNAPWTLKCDIAGQYVCRLLTHMDQNGLQFATPVDTQNSGANESIIEDFAPGYMQRAKHLMPRQGKDLPWRTLMHYGKDKKMLTKDPIVDGILQFDTENYERETKRQDLANAQV